MPITNITDERQIVQQGLRDGKDPEFIKQAVVRYRELQAPVQAPSMPILTNEQGGVGTALKDVSVGAGKSFLRGAIGTASLLQDVGKGTLGFLGFDTSKTGIKSLNDPAVAEQLKSKSRAEQVGTVLENVAEIGTGFIKSGAQATLKAKSEAKGIKNVFESITPKTTELTPTEYEDLLMKGKISPKTATEPAKYILSEEEKQIAYKYKDLLKAGDPVKNSINVVDEIIKKDAEVGNFLDKNNGIFNKGEVKNFVLDKLSGVTDVSIPEERVLKLKNTLIDNFLNKLPKKDMKNLWTGRKAFDSSIEKLFNGSPSLQSQVKREFRNAIQDYIAGHTKDNVYASKMKDMSQLFDLTDVLNTKAAKEKALTGIRLWIKNNPLKAKVIGWGAGAVGAQQAYEHLK